MFPCILLMYTKYVFVDTSSSSYIHLFRILLVHSQLVRICSSR